MSAMVIRRPKEIAGLGPIEYHTVGVDLDEDCKTILIISRPVSAAWFLMSQSSWRREDSQYSRMGLVYYAELINFP